MNYEYQYLLQQIKNLANKEHVISSGRSKSAEELSNGGLSIVVDTVQKYFAFKSSGLAEPVYIDPIGQKLINIKFINGVDVSKLISGITKGYGIKITDKGAGIYEIAVEEGKFALTSDVEQKVQEINSDIEAANGKISQIETKFGNYATAADIEKTYATKVKVEEVEDKFKYYTSTADLEAKYATMTRVNEVDSKFANYTTTADIDSKFANYTTTVDLEANYMKKDDVIPPSESQFEVVTEFPEYYVKNEHLLQETNKISGLRNDIPDIISNSTYNILKITPPTEVTTSIVSADGKKDIFKIVFRKNVIYDHEGRYTKEFVIYVEDHKVYSPIITLDEDGKECKINFENVESNNFFIACDTRLAFEAYSLYKQGNLSIMFLLSQNSLVAKQPSIKCNIIEAKNVLKLHESDIHYFYKPTIITEEEIEYKYRGANPDTSLPEDITEQIQCYKMIYKLPPASEYEIPTNMNFKFTEHCFGNVWSLFWNGTSWTGDNVSGRSNGKIENSKLYLKVDKKYNDYGCQGCYVRCKHDDWNSKFVGTSTNFMRGMFSYGKTRLLYKDGTIADGNTQRIDIERYSANVEAYRKDGYDYLPLYLRINNSDETTVKELLNKTEKIFLDMTINGALNRLSFRAGDIYKDQNFGYYIDLTAELDSIEKVNVIWSYTHITEGNRNIELYLRKDYTDPIEEVSWDPDTNPFDYIIQQQYYEIIPNPNAATTLYTDFNITSSKIITADNITTMRSDLNLVTNTVDVVSYDVKDIRSNVETLNSQMAEQKQVTDCLQKDVEQNRIIATTALAFGIAGTVGSVASIGMQLSSSGISFAAKAGEQTMQLSSSGISLPAKAGGKSMLKACAAEGMEHEMTTEAITIFESLPLEVYSLRSAAKTDITPLTTWINSEYKPISDIPFEEEYDDPKSKATSFYTAVDIANRFRESLKPAFKILLDRLNEVTDGSSEYVSIYDLVREDTIDVFANVDNEHKVINLTFEDTIVEGLIVFRTFAKYNGNSRQRRFYIKLEDSSITEYKGVQEDTVIGDLTLKALANSENDRVSYMPNAELILDSTEHLISIAITDANYNISGVIVEHCTCTRQMNFTMKDLAYRCDIEALDKKITTLAEQSHANDIATVALQDDYATIDEVNTVLTTNYVQKSELDTYATKTYVDENLEYMADTTLEHNCYTKNEVNTKLEDYRKKEDLSIGNYVNLAIEHKSPPYGERDFLTETAYVEFHEGAQLEGYVEVFDHDLQQYVHRDFSITFHTDEVDEHDHRYHITISEIDVFIWRSDTKIFYASGELEYAVHLNFAKIFIEDTLALKSQITELQAKITLLESRLATTKPYYTWADFYTGYTKIEMANANFDINHYVHYTYDTECKMFSITFNILDLDNFYDNLFCILQENNGKYRYFNLDRVQQKVFIDSIIDGDCAREVSFLVETVCMIDNMDLNITPEAPSVDCYFKAVYGKYA